MKQILNSTFDLSEITKLKIYFKHLRCQIKGLIMEEVFGILKVL
jgi:hypothetical protein